MLPTIFDPASILFFPQDKVASSLSSSAVARVPKGLKEGEAVWDAMTALFWLLVLLEVIGKSGGRLSQPATSTEPAISTEPSVWRSWHLGNQCSTPISSLGYELFPRFTLNKCSDDVLSYGALGSIRYKYVYTLLEKQTKYKLEMQIYDEFDVTCTGRPIAPPNIISREKLCNHDIATGFWVKTHAEPLPNELVTPQQLVMRSYSDPMCLTSSQFPVHSTRSIFIDKCMPVYYTKHLQPGHKQRLAGDILFYRKISYVSGPIGGATWDEGVKLTGGSGSATGTGVISGNSQGRILLAGGDTNLTLLVSRYNFEDDQCSGLPKTATQVKYVLQASSATGPSCLPDPLFPGTFYHVGQSVRPSAVPTARPTNPTAVPTPRPTRLPTVEPSTKPTPRPTPRPKPSPKPTSVPSAAPTPMQTYSSLNGSATTVGGVLYQDASYIYYVFANNGANNGTITPYVSGVTYDILLVAGGGGGGQGHAGGGGAGGVIAYINQTLPVGATIDVTVGQGGAGAAGAVARAQGFNGGNSLFGSFIAYGGGGGGSYTNPASSQGAGRGGGSGGGGGGNPSTTTAGSFVTGQGFGGGAGGVCDIAGSGGGGGGAGGAGSPGIVVAGTCASTGSGAGGAGGPAVSFVSGWGSLKSVLGLSGLGFWGQIAGGGGGGSWHSNIISPGGGGGAGSAPGGANSGSDFGNAGQAALPNTGSGGGGGPDWSVGGGAGGSGFVVVRVAKSSRLNLSKAPFTAPPPPPPAVPFPFSHPLTTFIDSSSPTSLSLAGAVTDVRTITLLSGTISGLYCQSVPGKAFPVTPSATFPSSASSTYWHMITFDDNKVKAVTVKVFLSSDGSPKVQAITAWYTAATGIPSTSAAADSLYTGKMGTFDVVTSSTGSGYGLCGLQGSVSFYVSSLPVTYYPTVSGPRGVALAKGNLLGTISSLPSQYTMSFDLVVVASPTADYLGILQLITSEAIASGSTIDSYAGGGGMILRLAQMTSGRLFVDSYNTNQANNNPFLANSVAPAFSPNRTTSVTITMDLTGGSSSLFTIWMTGNVNFCKSAKFTPSTQSFANVRVYASPPTGVGAATPANALIRNVKIISGIVDMPPLVWLDASKKSTIASTGSVVSSWSSTPLSPFGVQFSVDQGALSGVTWSATALGSSLPGVSFSAAGMKSATSPNLPPTGDYSVVFVGTVGSQAAVYGALFSHGNRDTDVVLERDGGSTNVIFQSNDDAGCPIPYTANQPMIFIATNTGGVLRNVLATYGNGLQTSVSCTNTYSLTTGAAAMRIGESDNTAEFGNGVVSEIIYYQRVLSASEISSLQSSLCLKWLGISCGAQTLPANFLPSASLPSTGMAVAASNLIGTVSLPWRYTVSFDVNPSTTTTSTWRTIMLLTGAAKVNNVWQRYPGFAFTPSGRTFNSVYSLQVDFTGTSTTAVETIGLTPGVWTTVTVAVDLAKNQMTISLSGATAYAAPLTKGLVPGAASFPTVNVWAAPPASYLGDAIAACSLRNVKISSGLSSAPPVLQLDAASYSGSGNTWTDSVGGLAFTLYGSPTYNATVGGGSFLFNGGGSGQYAQSTKALPTLGTWTVEAWHYYTGTEASNNGAEQWTSIVADIQSSSGANFMLGNTPWSHGIGASFIGTDWVTSSSSKNSPVLTAGNWYHLVGTYNGTHLVYYINGVLTASLPTTIASPTGRVGIGLMRRWDNAAQTWGGRLAIVRIYPSAFAITDVVASFNRDKARFAVAAPGDIVLSLDAASYSGSGNTWTDSVGGLAFTLYGSPTYNATLGGGSFSFSGGTSGQYAQSTKALPTLGTWTVEAWHYYTGTESAGRSSIVSDVQKNGGSSDNGADGKSNFAIGNFWANGFDSKALGAVMVFWFQSTIYATNSATNVGSAAASLAPGNWYHLVGTYDGAFLKLYINGVLAASAATAVNPVSGGVGIRLMADYSIGDTSRNWGGRLAIVRIYSGAFALSDVMASFNKDGARFGLSPLVLSSSLPQIWLDATSTSTMGISGTSVSSWASPASQSVFGTNFSVGANTFSQSPGTYSTTALNGRPGVNFASVDGLTSTAAFPLPPNGDMTLIVVGTIGPNEGYWGCLISSGNHDTDFALRETLTNKVVNFHTNNDNENPQVAFTAGQPMIIIATMSQGGTLGRTIKVIRADGTVSTASTTNPLSMDIGVSKQLYLATSDLPAERSKGIISELLYYHRVLSSSEQAAAVSSLSSKWNFPSVLGSPISTTDTRGMCGDPSGNLYVTQMGSTALWKVDAATGVAGIVNSVSICTGNDKFTGGCSADSYGNVYIPCQSSNWVLKLTTDGSYGLTKLGLTSAGDAYTWNQPVSTSFTNNVVYVAEFGAQCVKAIAANGLVSTVTCTGVGQPYYIASDTLGNVFSLSNAGILYQLLVGMTPISLGSLGKVAIAADGQGGVYYCSGSSTKRMDPSNQVSTTLTTVGSCGSVWVLPASGVTPTKVYVPSQSGGSTSFLVYSVPAPAATTAPTPQPTRTPISLWATSR